MYVHTSGFVLLYCLYKASKLHEISTEENETYIQCNSDGLTGCNNGPNNLQAQGDVMVKSTIQRLHRFILLSFLPYEPF